MVANAATASQLVVVARTSGGQKDRGGITLVLVDADADGVKIDDARCVAKSNPSFWDQLERLRGSGESELECDPGTPAL